jgi:hypothetical protein
MRSAMQCLAYLLPHSHTLDGKSIGKPVFATGGITNSKQQPEASRVEAGGGAI